MLLDEALLGERASASVCVAMKSTSRTWLVMSPRVVGLEKCEPTRLRIDLALPT